MTVEPGHPGRKPFLAAAGAAQASACFPGSAGGLGTEGSAVLHCGNQKVRAKGLQTCFVYPRMFLKLSKFVINFKKKIEDIS